MSHKDPQVRSRYYKLWYKQNRKREVARIKKNQKLLRQMIREAKRKPCSDCRVEYPFYVMQFDHVRGRKKFDVGRSYLRYGRQQILKEIAKCDVVCANDHAKRTWERGQYMPNEKNAPYSMAKKQRDNNRIVIEGIDEPARDPMTGVTDPKRLLKADSQRIDRNIHDPYDANYSHRAGAPEPVTKI